MDGQAFGGLFLDAGHAYGSLVGVPASQLPTMARIQPGDARRSYLWLRLQGAHGDGASPEASINHPGDGESRSVGVSLPFIGEAIDPEDGPLQGASMSWTSSEEGAIGTGATFEWTPTVLGEQSITLTAIDSAGNEGTDSLTLMIVP